MNIIDGLDCGLGLRDLLESLFSSDDRDSFPFFKVMILALPMVIWFKTYSLWDGGPLVI